MPPRSKKNKNIKKKKSAPVATAAVTMLPAVQAAIDSVVASHCLDMQAIIQSTRTVPSPKKVVQAKAPQTHTAQVLPAKVEDTLPPSLEKATAQPFDKVDATPPTLKKDNLPPLASSTRESNAFSQPFDKAESSSTREPNKVDHPRDNLPPSNPDKSLPQKSSADIPKPAPAYVPQTQQPVPLPKSEAPQPLPKDKKKKCIIL